MNERAYRRALALAHASRLDWAAWAMGLKPSAEAFALRLRLVSGEPLTSDEKAVAFGSDLAALPVPARMDDLHAPYLADCERRGVAPGPLPSLGYYNVDGFLSSTRVSWEVHELFVAISVGGLSIAVRSADDMTTYDERGSVADLVRMSELASAVAQADRSSS